MTNFKDQIAFQATTFQIPRVTDEEVVKRFHSLVSEADWLKPTKIVFHPIFAGDTVSTPFAGENDDLREFLNLNSVNTRSITVPFSNNYQIRVNRELKDQVVVGSFDKLTIERLGNEHGSALDAARVIAVARKHFDAYDAKPFLSVLDDGARSLYEAREADLQKLERMQENFFRQMTEFNVEQQKEHEEFRRKLEADNATRQSEFDRIHAERMADVDRAEAELRKRRAEIDERDNRQARRDIYKDLKKKLDERSTKFELTEGARQRRVWTLSFAVLLLALFATGFVLCFRQNAFTSGAQINWVALGSQIAFGAAFLGTATFFIRWTNLWSQTHAEEEFRLKRIDLDIDRASWLVELAMEWQIVNKSDFPKDLIEKLSMNLFTDDDREQADIHPAESLLSGLLGKSGSLNVEAGKMSINRNEPNSKPKTK